MKKEYLPVILLTFVNTLNFSIMIPVLPFIVSRYKGGHILYGLLLTMYPLFQFFSAPVLGALSDRYGRRPILLISQFGTVLGWLIFAVAYFVPEYYFGAVALPIVVIMLARIADGITGGNNSVANAYISDHTQAHEKTKVFGLLGGVVGLALILGPALGGYASSFGISYLGSALVLIVISTVAFILMFFFLPESLPHGKRDTKIQFSLWDEVKFITKLKKYTQNRRLKYLFFIRAFFFLVFTAYSSIVVLFIIDLFSLDPRQIGQLFFLIGLFLIINQVVIVRIFSKRFGDLKTFLLGQAVVILTLFSLQFINSLYAYIFLAYLMNLGFSISFPTFRSLLANSVDAKKQGEIMGIDESFLAASSSIAPICAAYVYEYIGQWAFGVFAVILLIPLIIFLSRYKKIRLSSNPPAGGLIRDP